MDSTLKVLASRQMPSGQFPTVVSNAVEGSHRVVHTITPTYLVCLILHELRERGVSHRTLDQIVARGTEFLARMCYTDPLTGLRVWHFNSFYAPDWEETAWCSFLLWKLGVVTRRELEPLRRQAFANETEDRGIGVWLKDDYSVDNQRNNVFDPVVSLSVDQFLKRIFNERSEPTERFAASVIATGSSSLYYADSFRDFLFFLFAGRPKPVELVKEVGYRLFHHDRRADVWYKSPDVWETAELAMGV